MRSVVPFKGDEQSGGITPNFNTNCVSHVFFI